MQSPTETLHSGLNKVGDMVALAHPPSASKYRQSTYLQHKDYKNFREQREATIIVPLADGATFFSRRILREKVRIFYTEKKEKKIFLTYREIQNGAVAKSI